jgi:hypothetical protein
MADVLAAHRDWNLARQTLKKSLRLDGPKGPIVRRAVRELTNARAAVSAAIEAARESKRLA